VPRGEFLGFAADHWDFNPTVIVFPDHRDRLGRHGHSLGTASSRGQSLPKHRKVGSHRRVLYEDLLEYARAMRAQQLALERMAANARELWLEY